jgi:hypothetical protein
MIVVVVCALIALSLVGAVLAPLWLCDEGVLLPSTIADNPMRLMEMAQKILADYLADEAAFRHGRITARQWQQRQNYLVNRYIDLRRRQDYLSSPVSRAS